MQENTIKLSLFVSTIFLISPAHAKSVVNCTQGKSLSQAVARADANETILFTGTCNGPVLIMQDGITLKGQGTAIIDGQHQTAVTVQGAQNVAITGVEVRNANTGILVDNQGFAALENVLAQDNSKFGIAVQNHSGVTLKNIVMRKNTIGLDVESASSATMNESLTTEDNFVFGMNINASTLTLNNASVIAQRNLLGIQLGTAASAFIADKNSSIHAMNNTSTGLTVVSGAHLVSFGGTIIANGNGRNGVSVNSKAGLDLDAASLLESYGNGGHGVQLAESSVMTLFNTTAFSGAPGSTTLNTHDNGVHGIAVLHGSNLTEVNQVLMMSQNNRSAGVFADNGSTITLVHSTVNDNATDLSLRFGARADIQTSTIGSIQCDTSTLIRGVSATCDVRSE